MKKGFLIKNTVKIKILNPIAWSKVLRSEIFFTENTVNKKSNREEFKVYLPNKSVIYLKDNSK